MFNTPAWKSISVDRGLALVVPMHRGAALSTPLRCPGPEGPESEGGVWVRTSEVQACGEELSQQWQDNLAGFTTYEAARDVAHFLAREVRDGERVFVFGGSYGAYWARRVMEVATVELDGVILEGAVPGDAHFGRLSESVDEAAWALLERCGSSSGCAAAFDGSPVDVARALIERDLEDRGCAAELGVSVTRRQHLFAATLLAEPALRVLLAPLVARWARCDPTDQEVLRRVLAELPDLTAEAPPAPSLEGTGLDPLIRNLRLGENIIYLDLMKGAFSLQQLEEAERPLLASNPNSRSFVVNKAVWPAPTYERSQPDAPRTPVPVLVFAGELDGRTPPSWAGRVVDALPAGTVRRVDVPWAGHMTFNFARAANGVNCTVEVWEAFMTAPDGALDLSCFERIPDLDLDGTSADSAELARRVLGTDGLFE